MEGLFERLTRLFWWLFKDRSFGHKNPHASPLLAISFGILISFVSVVIFMCRKKPASKLARRKLPAGCPVQHTFAQLIGLALQGW